MHSITIHQSFGLAFTVDMYSMSSRGSSGLVQRQTKFSIYFLLALSSSYRSVSLKSCLHLMQLSQSRLSNSSKCLLRACSAYALLLWLVAKPCFYKNAESTLVPFIIKSSPVLRPKILGKVNEAHISGPWASLTRGALNQLFETANTPSQRASWVNANPITFPSVIAKIGFLELIIAKLRSESVLAVVWAMSIGLLMWAILGLVKFIRSLPEEKLPPLPLMMMNLIDWSSLAQRRRLVKVQYISDENALYLLGRLKVIQNLLPLFQERMLVLLSGVQKSLTSSFVSGQYEVIRKIQQSIERKLIIKSSFQR